MHAPIFGMYMRTSQQKVIADNGLAGAGAGPAKRRAAILVRAGVGDFVLQGNVCGPAMRGDGANFTSYGVEVEPGRSDRYIIAGNKLTGNRDGGLRIGEGARGAQSVVANNLP